MKTNQFFPIVTVAVLLIAACKSKPEDTEQGKVSKVRVAVEQVKTDEIPGEINLNGNLEGKTTVKLGFMVSGKISTIHIKEGQLVSKGQLIANLDATNYALSAKLAEVQLSTSSDDLKRSSILHERGSITESDFVKANAAVKQARLQRDLQQKNVRDTRLYSPISGVLLKRDAEEGEVISPGTQLFTIAELSKVIVSAFVPEAELSNIKLGQKGNIVITALDKSYQGKVTEVGAIADASSRAFKVELEIENKDLKLRPGMVAEVHIANSKKQQAILLPVESIGHDLNNETFVYVVDTNKGQAFKRKVSLGGLFNNKVTILSGLNVGDQVVTSQQVKLSEGTKVEIAK